MAKPKPTKPTPKKEKPPPKERKPWRERFLAALRRTLSVSAAAEAAGHNRQHVYEVREADADFAAAWDDALAGAIEIAEGEAYRRATKGVKREKGVYYEGKCVATEVITEYSDTLLIFLLKAHKPKLYRESVQHEIKRGRSAEEMSDDELAAIASRAGRSGPGATQTPHGA